MKSLSFNKFTAETQHITTMAEVLQFARFLVFDLNLCFHPDDPFDQYVDTESHNRSFSDSEAAIGNRLMEECFAVCERENTSIYSEMGKAMDEYNDRVNKGVVMPRYIERQ